MKILAIAIVALCSLTATEGKANNRGKLIYEGGRMDFYCKNYLTDYKDLGAGGIATIRYQCNDGTRTNKWKIECPSSRVTDMKGGWTSIIPAAGGPSAMTFYRRLLKATCGSLWD